MNPLLLVAAQAVKNLRLEAVNDVHARWLPVTGPNGGLCVSSQTDPELVTAANYAIDCNLSLGGHARMTTVQNQLSAADTSDDRILRMVLGDEFQGTPLFTLPDLGGDKGYGASISTWTGMFTTNNTGQATMLPGLMVPGNHEFDGGVEIFNDYVTDLVTAGGKMICGNCDFGQQSCSANALPASVSIDVYGDASAIVSFYGLTVPDIQSVAAVPPECPIKSWDDIAVDLADLIDASAGVVIMSHMGIQEDVQFAKWATTNNQDGNPHLTTAQIDKIIGIYGGHSHSVICGKDSVLQPDSSGDVDVDSALLNGAGKVACEKVSSWSSAAQNALDAGAKTGDYPNYPMETSGFKIFHNGMHSWQYPHTAINLLDMTAETVQHILDSKVVIDEPTITEQKAQVQSVVTAAANIIGDAIVDIRGGSPCKIGYKGCGGGFFYAMASYGAGTEWVIPTVMSMTTAEIKASSGALPMGVIINGGSVRATIDQGEVSWVELNTTFPFLNNLSGGKVLGSNLKQNMVHGLLGHGGAQMAGLRIVTHEDADLEAYIATANAAAAAAGEQIGKWFCTEAGNPFPSTRKVKTVYRHSGAHPLGGRQLVYPEEEMDILARDFMNRTTTVPAKIDWDFTGCATTFDTNGMAFEINTCMAAQFANERDAILESGNYFPPKEYADCNCWETINDATTYALVTADFVANGGDNYCFDFDTTQYDYIGKYGDELGCTGVAIDFIDHFSKSMDVTAEPTYIVAAPVIAEGDIGGACKAQGACNINSGSQLVCYTYDDTDGSFTESLNTDGICYEVNTEAGQECNILSVACMTGEICGSVLNGVGTCATTIPDGSLGGACTTGGNCGKDGEKQLVCYTYDESDGSFTESLNTDGICYDVTTEGGTCNILSVACPVGQNCGNVDSDTGLGTCAAAIVIPEGDKGGACKANGDCNTDNLICYTFNGSDGTFTSANNGDGTCYDVAELNGPCDIASTACPVTQICGNVNNIGVGTCATPEEPEGLIGAHCDAQGQCGVFEGTALTCMTYNPNNGGFAPTSGSSGICMDVVSANGSCNINQVACQPTQICGSVVEDTGLGMCEDSGPAMGAACSVSGDCGVLNGSGLMCQTYDANDGTWSPASNADGKCFAVAEINGQCDIANVSCRGSQVCTNITNGLGTCSTIIVPPMPPTPGSQHQGVHYATHRDPDVRLYAPERIGGKGAFTVYALLWNPDFPAPRPF